MANDSAGRAVALICRLAISGFILAYVLTLALFLTGIFGWFRSPQGLLAGVFLLLLGLPWNQLIDRVPESIRPFLAAAALLLNLAILLALCDRFHASTR
jgi:hypothetical protein